MPKPTTVPVKVLEEIRETIIDIREVILRDPRWGWQRKGQNAIEDLIELEAKVLRVLDPDEETTRIPTPAEMDARAAAAKSAKATTQEEIDRKMTTAQGKAEVITTPADSRPVQQSNRNAPANPQPAQQPQMGARR